MSKTKEHAKNIPNVEERRRTSLYFPILHRKMEIICFLADKSPVVLFMYNFVFSGQLTKGIYASGRFVWMENNKWTPSINNYV